MRSRFFLIVTFVIMGLSFSSFQFYQVTSGGDDPDNCLDDLDVPKLFTPNGDGENDAFSVPFPCKPESFEIELFNRFGELMFTSKDYDFIWNGIDQKGRQCQSDVYSWKIRYMYHMNYVEVAGEVLLLL